MKIKKYLKVRKYPNDSQIFCLINLYFQLLKSMNFMYFTCTNTKLFSRGLKHGKSNPKLNTFFILFFLMQVLLRNETIYIGLFVISTYNTCFKQVTLTLEYLFSNVERTFLYEHSF